MATHVNINFIINRRMLKAAYDSYLASIMNIGREFGVSDGGIVQVATSRVIRAILSLKDKFIYWPSAAERRQIALQLTREIDYFPELPLCVGFLDGTHIPLFEKPEDDPADYMNRKNQYSIQLQLTVDQTRLIRHLYGGFPGSVHDSRVLTHTDMYTTPSKYFSSNEYLIGDSAYPLSKWLITPYRRIGGTIPDDKRAFNYHISGQRVKVEHANGILKRRFQSLNGLRLRVNKQKGHKLACEWIVACCVLYNFLSSDPWSEEDIENDILQNQEIIDCMQLDDDETDEETDSVAVDKREALKEYIQGRSRRLLI